MARDARTSFDGDPVSSSLAERLLLPVNEFIHTEGRSSIVLLVATVLALVWANSAFSESYFRLWETTLTFDLAWLTLSHDLRHWINDGLMALFFFVVGLEIKRELVHGEISDRERAALPVAAALGGIVVPIGLFLLFNAGRATASGWAIPMATDIAFALGVLALLGRRVPTQLRVFLLAVAIIDDVGSILVIAFAYSAKLQLLPLVFAAIAVGVILLLQRLGIQRIAVYMLPGVALWLAFHESGIHATLSGVILALLTPSVPRHNPDSFDAAIGGLLDRFRQAIHRGDSNRAQALLGRIEDLARLTEAPLERLERRVHPWSNYAILPLFALANAGVRITFQDVGEGLTGALGLGILAGLLLGKPIGITAFGWLAVRTGLARKPSQLRWTHIGAAGMLAGIGFTVALFLSGLAFEEVRFAEHAKLSILAASTLAGLLGYLLLRLAARGRS